MSTFFVFRPHVRQGDIVITPDFVLDRVVVEPTQGEATVLSVDRLTSVNAVRHEPGSTLHPGVALVAAEFGPLLGLSASLANGGSHAGGPKLLGRQVWRLADVADHSDRLRIRAFLVEGTGPTELLDDPVSGGITRGLMETDRLTRGTTIMRVGGPVAESMTAPATIELELVDPVLERSLLHRVQLEPLADGLPAVAAQRAAEGG